MKANILLRRIRAYQRRRAELTRLSTGLIDRAEAARHERARLVLLEVDARDQLATFLGARKLGPWSYRVAAQVVGLGARP